MPFLWKRIMRVIPCIGRIFPRQTAAHFTENATKRNPMEARDGQHGAF
jgi:hypothetical protein